MPNGVRVSVSMSLHPVVAVFMLVWFAGVGLGVVASVWVLLTNLAAIGFGFVIPLGMLVFGVVLVYIGFVPEARKAKRLLEEILWAPA